MNYLAHLYLAQPTPHSHFGNLLGDFRRGVHLDTLPNAVQLGLENHLLVDKFTDQHDIVRNLKARFAKQRRRFAGVAIDVAFDHLLIKHWHRYSHSSFVDFRRRSYGLLQSQQAHMPKRMHHVVGRICHEDWFATYATLEGVDLALNNIAKRIRFENSFHGAAQDIDTHFDEFNAAFLAFFPELIEHVQTHSIEASRD